MPHTSQISPCYAYRYQLEGESDAEYAERCAAELEQEILRVGDDKVAAFFAETSEFCSFLPFCIDMALPLHEGRMARRLCSIETNDVNPI
jgi:hypothetical protein